LDTDGDDVTDLDTDGDDVTDLDTDGDDGVGFNIDGDDETDLAVGVDGFSDEVTDDFRVLVIVGDDIIGSEGVEFVVDN
jgi:hypothetical protein